MPKCGHQNEIPPRELNVVAIYHILEKIAEDLASLGLVLSAEELRQLRYRMLVEARSKKPEGPELLMILGLTKRGKA